MPQRFPYLTALQSKFKLSPTELAQRRGVIGIITGTLGRFRKPPPKAISAQSHLSDRAALWGTVWQRGQNSQGMFGFEAQVRTQGPWRWLEW